MKKIILSIFCILISFKAYAYEYSSVISIDVTDKSAISAKQKAWTRANRVALNNVMNKISNNVSLDYLTDEQILNLVKQTEVLSEKNSDVRYIGKLKIVFNKELLDNFLEEKNIERIDVYTSKVLLIPLYNEGYMSQTKLWEEDNKLKQAFQENRVNGVVKIQPIKATANNYFLTNIADLTNLNRSVVSKIAQENMTQDVFIVEANKIADNQMYIKINHYKDAQITTDIITVNEQKNNLFKAAVIQISQYINSQIKENSINTDKSEKSISFIYNFYTLQQWVSVKKQLSKINYIKDISPTAMQNGRVEFKVEYVGNYNQLLSSLQASGFIVNEDVGYYILERI